MKRSTKTVLKRQTDARSLRKKLVAIAEAQAVDSMEPLPHTHIECLCGNEDHRSLPDSGVFCSNCATIEAIKRGFDADDTMPKSEGTVNSPQWCRKCYRLITLRSTPYLLRGLSPEGAMGELDRFETKREFGRTMPSTPTHWRVLLLVIDSIADEHLKRVEAVVNRRTTT